MRHDIRTLVAALLPAACCASALGAEYMEKNAFQRQYAFSPAVITEGGRTVWLAGATALRDESGKDISGQFEPQVRAIFRQMDQQLKKAGGSLANLVTMTVFVVDPGNVPRFVQLRKEFFGDGNFPASTLIAGAGFALPGIVVEIQGVAAVGDSCSNSQPCSHR